MNTNKIKMSYRDREDLQEAWEAALDNLAKVESLCKRFAPDRFNRYKTYGFNTISAGLGEGDAMPCMSPVNELVESLLENDDDETVGDETEDD